MRSPDRSTGFPHAAPSQTVKLEIGDSQSVDELQGVKEGERGVLYCCGKRLTWEEQEGSVVQETSCPTCGAIYAMDPGGDLDDNELGLGT